MRIHKHTKRLTVAIAGLCVLCGAIGSNARAGASGYEVTVLPETVKMRGPDVGEIAVYHRESPAGVDLGGNESAGFFHPFRSPSGRAVTDLAPEDHKYHRGIFFGWIEMHGEKSADFWGWGARAPAEDRRIVHRRAPRIAAGSEEARFVAENVWVAEDAVMGEERLEARVRAKEDVHLLDLEFVFTPTSEITLPRNAFSGFVFRTRTDGAVEAFDPDGAVNRPAPSHVDPDSNWPARPWYAYTIDLDDGSEALGAAVIDHPANPPADWHNVAGIGLLNPVIVSPDEVTLEAGEPLVLRYRLVAFDGEVPAGLLNDLAEAW